MDPTQTRLMPEGTVPVNFTLKRDCEGSQLSGGIIALIIIAVIVLVALVGSLAAFIQKQIDVNALKKNAQEAAQRLAETNNWRIVAAGGVKGSDAPAQPAPAAHALHNAAASSTQHALAADCQDRSAMLHSAVASTDLMLARNMDAMPALPIGTMYQQGLVQVQRSDMGEGAEEGQGCGGASFNAQHQQAPNTSLLTPQQMEPLQHARGQMALGASLADQQMAGAITTCNTNQTTLNTLQNINAAMNAKGSSMMNQKQASLRAMSQAMQPLIQGMPGLANRLASATPTTSDNDAFVADMPGTQLLSLQDRTMGQYNNGASGEASDNGKGMTATSTLTSLDVSFGGRPDDRKGITAQQYKELMHNSNPLNTAPQSTILTADEVTLARQNNLALQCAAAKDPRMAFQYLNAVGASNPVTVTGMKAALARQPSLQPMLSTPGKNMYGMDDAGARPALAMPSMSAVPVEFGETLAAAYARGSQSCTAASLV